MGRPPQKQVSHVGTQGEDEKYLTVEPKKSVGAKLPQKGRAVASFPGSSQTSVEENLPQAVNKAKLAARKLCRHMACMSLCH